MELWAHDSYMDKPSAVGQPTRPTQPFILTGSINEYSYQLVLYLFVHSVVAPSGELRDKGRYGVLCSVTTV